jgi:drug/metabolite transporter (DMT)-like permease
VILPAVLALAAAFAYGLSDFLGGLAARRLHYLAVVLLATAAAAAVTLVAAIGTPAIRIDGVSLAWGAAAGLGSALGGMVLYRGLGRGRMAVVAPLSALGAAILPILVGVVVGDRPSATAWSGIAIALPAIWLVSRPAEETPTEPRDVPPTARRRIDPDVVDGLLAGAGFALLFIGLDAAGDSAGLWPVVASEIAALVVLSVIALAAGTVRTLRSERPSGSTVVLAVVAGSLSGAAASAYFLATHDGLLSVVAVLASLYPAVTVVLAALVLREAIGRWQLAGLAAAGVAIALIVAG